MSTDDYIYIHNHWKRYLDDCFIIWKQGPENLETFINQINNLHPSIRFTSETDPNSIPFLDVKIIKKGNAIETDIYRKPTDTMNYIDFNSCHPRHTRTNIPYNLASRVVTIVSDPDQRKFRLQELQDILLTKNYPEKLIQDAIRKSLNTRTRPNTPLPPKKNPSFHIYP